MKSLALFSLAGLSLAAVFQSSLPAPLATSLEKLDKANGFKATFTVINNGGASEAMTLTYAKPNLMRIDSAGGFTVSDGKVVTVYNKATNSFTETPVTPELTSQSAMAPNIYAWAGFFSKDAGKAYKMAKLGGKRNIKGNLVSEVTANVSGAQEGTITIFVDEKLGLARGFSFKTSKSDLLVVASEIEASEKGAPASTFTFVAPEGAKKAEAAVSPANSSAFKDVQALFNRTCMPCHSSRSASGGFDLTHYEGIKAGVTPNNADASLIVRDIRSGRMPKNKQKLAADDIKLVENWVMAGAKNE